MTINQETLLNVLLNGNEVEEVEEAVRYCGLIIERITFKGKKTSVEEVDELDINSFDKDSIVNALLKLSERYIIQEHQIIWALGKSFDGSLKGFYFEKLKKSLKGIDDNYSSMFQLICELDKIGAEIIPYDKTGTKSISSLDIQKNIEAVRTFLAEIERGRLVGL